ncbi:DEAD/DEAH box helicase, partial [Frankia sp. Cas4]|uniref:DEAD/DEAH box helicase n=1 Tax=Frankia sp. Cas4 TaxID=3073927 RepID=UPI002AD50320
MIPSLLARETRAGVLEYLTTTFALADDEARAALQQFLEDPEHGIFRGPYLRLRTPFRPVDARWRSPLGWLPRGFQPYLHQARAFERLSTDGRAASPTIVTTGTGSGKTESFLIPILDHARRARERGEDGIKAILLYPMNALVTDQARRLAGYLDDEPALAGVSAGVYIGGTGSHATPTPEHLVDRREVLRAHPPDILLTNYKMLDFLLLRREDAGMWQRSATSLQFVVLDEFHTYDGAQGTDVAMLLRRLGATLRLAEPGRPLGRVVPVATSATLGGGSRREDMCVFAERVFGTPFDADALIGEERLEATDVVAGIDFNLPVPKPQAVNNTAEPTADDPASWAELAEVFGRYPPEDGQPVDDADLTDPLVLGERLQRHFITRAAAHALSGAPLSLSEAVDTIAEAGVLPWGVSKAADPGAVALAVLRFLALLSYARVSDGAGRPRPLLHVEVQLWIREIRRMLRAVDDHPRFAWWHDGAPEAERTWLPAAYCRHCGRSGWQAVAPEVGDVLRPSPLEVWQTSVRDRGRVRTLLLADAGEPGVRHLVPTTCELLDAADEGTVAVLVTADAEQADAQRCPACGADDAVRFLGSSVATLVSVALTQLFGSDLAAAAEKKTLVFTDSVQDAAHRAAFIEGRAFQFNLRSMLLGAIGDGPTSIAAVARRLAAAPAADLYAVTPPDFPRRLGLEGEWLRKPTATLRRILNSRLAFQTQLEFGLRSRLGRTLELTGTVAVDFDVDLDQLAVLVQAVHEQLPERALDGMLPEPGDYQPWLWGLLDRLRTGGGILHDSLTTYINRDGDRYPIWGGSGKGMPKFPRGMAAPTLFTTGTGGRWKQFAALSPLGDSATWLTDWTARCLGVPPREGKALLSRVAAMLAGDEVGVWQSRTTTSGATVYGWHPDRIMLAPVESAALAAGRARLRCEVCRYLQAVAPHRQPVFDGRCCPRFRCPGRLRPEAGEPANFYRTMYRSGRVRRIVTHEHTGLLDRELREDVERRFKANTSPVDPNILACTPTLELGIDIGDLGAVTLASLPRATANYLQRVGRAGRSTGNALVLAGVPSGPRDLYYFAEPSHLINGEVRPPGAYLDATELLCRQFFAYCLDRVAAGDLVLPTAPPNLTGQLAKRGLEPGGWMRQLLDAVAVSATALAGGFLDLFGAHLHATSREAVHAFATGGIETAVSRAFGDWTRRDRELVDRLTRLQESINDLDGQGHLDDEQRADRRRWIGERSAVRFMLDRMRDQPLLTGLEQMGLLPNYTLIDDRTVLDVSLWWTTDDGDKEYQTAEYRYERGSMTAIAELAPGSAFYAHGQRVRVDAVDIGPVEEPLWQQWRLCPHCGWGTDAVDQVVSACPRCGRS